MGTSILPFATLPPRKVVTDKSPTVEVLAVLDKVPLVSSVRQGPAPGHSPWTETCKKYAITKVEEENGKSVKMSMGDGQNIPVKSPLLSFQSY